jgi:hypothetical protein
VKDLNRTRKQAIRKTREDHALGMKQYPWSMNTIQRLQVVIGSVGVLFALDGEWNTVVAQDESGRMPPLVIETPMTPLLPINGLSGWKMVSGDAAIEYKNGELHGYGAGGRNAFLMSDRIWGDFVLEGEVHIQPGGNSGWQIRSWIDDPKDLKSRLRGYQVEVETTDRRWSGGIYEEGRRGWLDPLLNDEEARAAFRIGEWNRYRIEAEGIHLRTWVNGVPCGDLLDLAEIEGHLAFQIHTGTCDVRWRNLEIIDCGRSRFIEKGAWKTRSETGDVTGNVLGESIEFIPPEKTSVIRFTYDLEEKSVLMIVDRKGRTIAELGLHEKQPFRSGKGAPSRFPEVVPGAGIDVRKDERHEMVIDLHQGRLTVIRDGVVVVKRYDLGGSRLGVLQIKTSLDHAESIKIYQTKCLVNEAHKMEVEE